MTAREKKILSKTIEIIIENLNPQKIIMFGSRAKGKSTINSDFDLAVDMKRPDIRTRRIFEEKIYNEVGLYSVDLIYLNSIEKNFRDLVLKTGRVVYER
ncbi:MAG: nucleotidyltransferase domain-containing protein [Bacteroidota bacterium]|nr:nucleotidyltransferase domain-containing protein [Bacteroidota bacterium]